MSLDASGLGLIDVPALLPPAAAAAAAVLERRRGDPEPWTGHRGGPRADADAARRTGRTLQLSKFYPPVMGGIETVAWELTEGLNRAGMPTDVLCSHHLPRTVVDVAEAGYAIVRAASLGRVLSTSVAPAMVRELARLRDAYDVIHLHMPDPMGALAVFLTRPAAKLVVHWHSDVVRQRVAMHAYRHLQDWVLRRADAVVATSLAYAQASDALRAFQDKVTVIPIGIGDARQQARAETTADIRGRFPGCRLVFALGRMTHYKGFEVLVRAAERLPADCRVLIGGDGQRLAQLQRDVARRDLDDKVVLLGHVQDNELFSWFEACDVFCMPSTLRAEAYGVAMVEAMVMGRPIVASDIPGSGVPWVNQHERTGLNVPVGDADALAGALCRLLDDVPLRRRMGATARGRYQHEFRADLMTERTLDLYDALLAPANATLRWRRGEPAPTSQHRAPRYAAAEVEVT
jgi:glycosyltransferase involved in cell wall biosynthesis